MLRLTVAVDDQLGAVRAKGKAPGGAPPHPADRPAERAARTIRQQWPRRLKDMPRCFLENSCKELD